MIQDNSVPTRSIPQITRFFFTERGRKEIGRRVMAGCKQSGQEFRVISVKERSVDVVWGDEYDMAVQVNTARSRKSRWLYETLLVFDNRKGFIIEWIGPRYI